MKKLDKNVLRKTCDIHQFDFETTEEVSDKTVVLGQERLSSAMEFGINIDKEGFNIFAHGPDKTDKRNHIQQFLEKNVESEDPPQDLCYVNNFDDRYKPKLLMLPTGRGSDLKKKMNNLIEEIPPTLKAAFETEEYQNRQQALQEEIQHQQDQTFEDLQNKAREKGLALMRTPAGFSFAPVNDDGEPMSENEVKELSEDERQELQDETKKLQEELQELIRQMPAIKRKMREKKKELDEEVATFAVKDLFDEIRGEFTDLEEVQEFLDRVEIDIVENVQAILNNQNQQGQKQLAQMMGGQQMQQSPSSSDNPILDRYRVNLLVDNSENENRLSFMKTIPPTKTSSVEWNTNQRWEP